jgi:hypothetical protein
MVLEIVLPEKSAKSKTTKDMVFSLLVDTRERTLTQLHREIKKRFRVSISFQAVIKAVKSLLEQEVLQKNKRLYSIDKDWIFKTRNFFDSLYKDHFKVKQPIKKMEHGKDITIYTVHNLLEIDRLWNELLTNWAHSEKSDKRNCWKGRHAWWIIPRLQEEDILHDFMIKRDIKTYNLWISNSALDKSAMKYYKGKREFTKSRPSIKLSADTHIAAFGDTLIKFEIPKAISRKLETLYSRTKSVEDLDMKKVIDIFKEEAEIEYSVIKDKFLADQVKTEIISHF